MGRQSLNSPCNCGSGKKYKRCCGLNGSANEDPVSFVQKYNTGELLRIIGALSIMPENHGKNVRLDSFAALALLHHNDSSLTPSRNQVNDFLQHHYRFHHDEDPATNLFTDLLIFYGGDIIVYPGIMGNGIYNLNNLLMTIFQYGTEHLPIQFVTNATHVCKLILYLSNSVAQQVGHNRYMGGVSVDNTIYVPAQSRLSLLTSAISFSIEEMLDFLVENNISKDALDEFLVEPNTPGLNAENTQENPILFKPIYFDGKGYTIISPTNLAYALVNSLWLMAKSWNCINELSTIYHEFDWAAMQTDLIMMGFQPIEHQITTSELYDVNLYWNLFRFDDDKIALIQYIFDDALDYSPTGYRQFDYLSAYNLKKDIAEQIKNSSDFCNNQLFDLSFTASIGRTFLVAFQALEGTNILNIPVPEFETLSQLNDCSAIDLWKFSIAKRTKMPKTSGLMFSFLDYYKLYKENHDSFYLSDKQRFSYLHLEEGYGSTALLLKAKRNSDIHSAKRFQEGNIVFVPVKKQDHYSPIYASRSDVARGKLFLLVEGLPQPIWVKPWITDIDQSLRRPIWEFADAIAYWIWQISEEIRPYLEQLRKAPIVVCFKFQNHENFARLQTKLVDLETLSQSFEVEVDALGITISIPDTILPYLEMPHNEGERQLVKYLLIGFSSLLSANSKPSIKEQDINRIIEEIAPTGLKKKFFIVNAANNLLLDKRFLKKHRYVQDYDTGEALDLIVPLLGENCPPNGIVPERKDKIKLARNIVFALLGKLTDTINLYNCEELLQRLIGLIESLTHKREDMIITLPTREECYQSSEIMLEELREQQAKINRTSIAVRCLIEHVAAEQSIMSHKKVSTTAIDELIALMDQIVSWGMIGDQLNFELFNLEIEILPTKRIGTEKKELNDIFEPYSTSKAKEDIDDARRTFTRHFDRYEGVDTTPFPENIDRAFLEDFGVSFLRICYFIDSISELGAVQKSDYCTYEVENFFEAVNSVSEDKFSAEEFEAAIRFLTLTYRGNVGSKPEGCDNNDISPWRFNRRLSLLRRPLILLKNTSDGIPRYYWGLRNTAITKKYLYDSITAGRLRVDETGRVNKVMGKLANGRGDSLVDKVASLLRRDGTIVQTEVKIGPSGSLIHADDIGDIDCLVIHGESKTLFSLECKAMAPSRNIKEMVEELSKLLGSESEKGWIEKHTIRHEWLDAHKADITAKYGIDVANFEVVSVFVTREQMLAPFVQKNLQLPFITLYDLENAGMQSLAKIKSTALHNLRLN